ncbi:hypothetical protein [Proteiniclasticum ruminis]|uniref:Lipoprotein n=1 Tax=Proteiniclasticum ruminis TaxID=398199 RepID=A0A1I4ZX84_9CLOT|nr:hypothetical protein [Proteiniclasticum ruminis]SFN54659.1 hypothetical protein SAMN04488695_102197 [Proteiniclasticum ruminis]
MKKFFILLLAIMFGIFIIGCDEKNKVLENEEPNDSSVQWDRRPAIMVDRELYLSTGEILSIEVDESSIRTVSSLTSSHLIPTKEGEINFPFPEAKYAKLTGDTDYVVVMVEEKWERFSKEKDLKPKK